MDKMNPDSSLAKRGNNPNYVPIKDENGLTPKQLIFVEGLQTGLSQTESARRAGYKFPDVAGCRLAQKPAVRQMIRKYLTDRIETQGAMIGVRALEEVAQDCRQPGAARVSAAKALLNRAGIVEKPPENSDLGGKLYSEMTLPELQSLIKQGEEQHQKEVLAIDITPEKPIESDG